MKNRKLLTTLALFASAGLANATEATIAADAASTLTTTIATVGGAMTAVVVAGVGMRFLWKWLRAVR